ncbi:MAG: septation protein IspZ [Gammaproteobacteria bacterium]|nr:septation protein IspZ [Gammaproteobacteria bacterium]MDD9894501.1 septation protein IspZ [Gammaproteobacteria bacterium]MDD9958186.1 septation protein IspZ [Gammaproteobacteria bacterium]
MKQFIDYIPLLVFFSVWAMDERVVTLGEFERTVGGIFSAAEVLLVVSILVYGTLFLVQKRLDKFQWITLGGVVIFCSLTVAFQSVTFLKWKAPIVNWIFAAIFFGSRFISEKPAIEHMMGHAVDAPKELWLRLNNYWIYYFIALGLINLVVAFTLSEAAWIQFKVFGNLVLTFVFVFAQMPLLMKYIEVEEEETTDSTGEESA